MNTLTQEAEPELISNTIHNFYGYRLRRITTRIHLKRKYKLVEKWFCLKEGEGQDLPTTLGWVPTALAISHTIACSLLWLIIGCLTRKDNNMLTKPQDRTKLRCHRRRGHLRRNGVSKGDPTILPPNPTTEEFIRAYRSKRRIRLSLVSLFKMLRIC